VNGLTEDEREAWAAARLRYGHPARRWTEALPLGNGWLGAMVHGGVHQELLNLNADTFWSGMPRDWDVPGAAKAVREARALTLAGDLEQAEGRLRDAQGPFAESYLPLGDLVLDLHHRDGAIDDYERGLDLDTAVAWTSYSCGRERHSRRAWTDADLGVLVLHHAVEDGTLDVQLALDGPFARATEPVGADGLRMTCKAPAHVVPSYLSSERPFIHDDGVGHGMYAVAAVRVLTDGRIEARDGALAVSGASTVTVLLTAATGFQGHDTVPDRSAGDCAREAEIRLATAAHRMVGDGLDSVLAAHVERHRGQFRRVRLSLGDVNPRPADTLELIHASQHDDLSARALDQLLFQYGRYLLIASSQPGTQAANLQGIWNHDPRPPWSSNYTLNINTQMNYWLSGPAGLIDLELPLFDLVQQLATTGARTASTSYGLPGWVAHHNTDLWRQSMAVGDGDFPAVWANWWMGGAWLAHHLWDHYTFSLDTERLRQVYPALRSAAEFLLAWVFPGPDGALITAPSTSPENSYVTTGEQTASVTWATTMDLALVAQVLLDVEQACGVLDIDRDFAETCRDARRRLRRPRVGSRGQLLEWPEEHDEPDPHHRHVSHLVGIFPGDVHASDRALVDAARVTLDERGDASTGWSRAWKANLWARLGDGDRAVLLLRGFCTEVLTEDVAEDGGIYANLLCAHPPFQIDGNFGFTSAVCQMLVHSRIGRLELLPALPTTWPAGNVRGIHARGGITVDLDWRGGRLTGATLCSRREQVVTVVHATETREVTLRVDEPVSLPWTSLVHGSP
jgi:alpha-L-fucosidase 2